MKYLLVFFCLVSTLFAVELQWEPLYEPGSGGQLSSVQVSPHNSNHVLLGGDMLGIGVSWDQGESWEPTFGLKSWEIAEFTFHPTDPNIVWAGTMSGPYVSTDGGVNWEERREGMPDVAGYHYSVPIDKILFDPNDSDHFIAVSGSHRRWNSPGDPMWGAVWESTDAGDSWTHISTIRDDNGKGQNILAAGFASASSEIIYAAVNKLGVYISEDGGETWEPANDGLPHTHVEWVEPHPHEAHILWAALGNAKTEEGDFIPGGIYKSRDYGQTWTPQNDGLSQNIGSDENRTAKYRVVVACQSDPSILFTSNTSWTGANLYISRDGGETWEVTAKRIDKAYPAGKSMKLACFDPNNSDVIFAAGDSYVLRTTNGGESWIDATSYHPDGSDNWRGRGYSGLVCKAFYWDPNDPSHAVLMAMDAGNFWHSQDYLYSWEKPNGVPTWGGGNDMTFSGTSTMYAAFGQYNFQGIGRTTDGGKRWKTMTGSSHGLPDKYAGTKPTSIYAHPLDSTKVWAVIGGDLYFSGNMGDVWTVIFDDTDVHWISKEQSEPLHFYLATQKGVYETFDGQTFEAISGSPKPATKVSVDPNNDDVIYVTSWRERGGLWRYDHSSWEKLHSDDHIKTVAVKPGNPDFIAFITDDHPFHDVSYATGVYVSEDAGETWSQKNNGLACLRGSVLIFNPHNPEQIVVGTGGRGFFIHGAPEASVDQRSQTVTPKKFRMLPNYPNPFNNQTRLCFDLAQPANVSISIFTVLGKRVDEVNSGWFAPGRYEIDWHAADADDRALTSGVYFVRYDVNNRVFQQKLLYVR